LKGGRVIFSVTHPDDGHGHFQRLAEYVGVNTAKAPAIMLIHAAQDISKFQYSGDFSAASISDFVSSYNAGTLSKYLKSEEIPTT
jgi:protein disulfide-isomerase A1